MPNGTPEQSTSLFGIVSELNRQLQRNVNYQCPTFFWNNIVLY